LTLIVSINSVNIYWDFGVYTINHTFHLIYDLSIGCVIH